MSSPDIVGLRSRLAGPSPLFGIFTRLTDPVAYETIALTDVGVLMIDAEHGSFGRAALAQCIFALRCAGKYVLVRLPDDNLAACARDSNIDFALK
jgi:2-keto-3-deoxy-L-rhamnonate aldolase RhmA